MIAALGVIVTGSLFELQDRPLSAAPAQVPATALSEAVGRYNALRQVAAASALELCERADAVALAYLQAADRAGYEAWEQVESKHCAAAGFPRGETPGPHES